MNNPSHFPLDFATPLALWLLLLLPIWWVLRRIWRPPTITFSRAEVISHGPKGHSWYPRVLFILRNLLFFLLIVAIARPRIAKPTQLAETEGINIELLVDLSSSMLSQDFQPRNRLAVAKESMEQFVMGRNTDRVGLIAFANEAYTVTPLTTDYSVLVQDIDNLRVGQLDDGTAIGDAITAGANRLMQAPGASKVMILLTDGVSNRGKIDPLTGARVANTYGIKIYTIGVGKQGMAPVPVAGPDGKMRTTMMPVEIDEQLMTHVAEMTGGRYFRAVDALSLDHVYRQIDALERNTVKSTVYAHYVELYRWPLGLMIVLLLLELWIAAVRAPIP